MYRKLVDDYPDSAEYRSSLAKNHLLFGVLLCNSGRPQAAEAEVRAALALYQKLADENPAVTDFRFNVVNGREWLGAMVLSIAGRTAEAEAECRSGLDILRRLADENPAVTDFRCLLSVAHNNLSELMLQKGETVAAETESRTALAIMQPLADEHRSNPVYRDYLGSYRYNLGDVLRVRGKLDEARNCYEQAIAAVGPAAADRPASYNKRSRLAYSLRRHGLALRDLGDQARAAAETKQALLLLDGLPPSPWNLFEAACCHAALASMARRSGSDVSAVEGEQEFAKAMDWLRRAVANGFRNMNLLRIESALDPLRDRDDFKKLIIDPRIPR
jgi:tetratricopeptide (TPR) repeat protein